MYNIYICTSVSLCLYLSAACSTPVYMMYTYTHMYTCIIYIFVPLYLYVYIYICLSVCLSIYLSIYLSICLCICTCICTHTHASTYQKHPHPHPHLPGAEDWRPFGRTVGAFLAVGEPQLGREGHKAGVIVRA